MEYPQGPMATMVCDWNLLEGNLGRHVQWQNLNCKVQEVGIRSELLEASLQGRRPGEVELARLTFTLSCIRRGATRTLRRNINPELIISLTTLVTLGRTT